MTKGTRKPGEFCWINLMTPKPAEACEFFGKILGWTYFDMAGMGYGISVDGHQIGGLFDVVSPRTPNGMPPVIGVMVKVDSADACGEKARSLGGRAEPAFDIMDSGRMAVCHDPNGAQFDVWEPKKMQGTDVDTSLHGAPSWFETLTTDVDRAGRFYSGLFGWTQEQKPMAGFTYTLFKQGPALVAGMMPIMPQMGNLSPHWSTNFTVKDVDVAASQATKLGATICVPAQDIAGVGRFCGITSPQGVTFFVIKYVS